MMNHIGLRTSEVHVTNLREAFGGYLGCVVQNLYATDRARSRLNHKFISHSVLGLLPSCLGYHTDDD
jgi:hypothetical protein